MAYASFPYGGGPYGAVGAAASWSPSPGNVLFLSPRDSDIATMTASTAVSSLPVANLQNQEPSRVWRSTSPLSQYVDITFARAGVWNAAAMSAFNGSDAMVWRLNLYDTAAGIGGTPGATSGWQSVWPQNYRHGDPEWGPEVALLRLDDQSANYRYARVEFSDPGSTAGYLDVGRLAVGRAAQFGINCDFGNGIAWAPNDTQEPNGWGQVFTEPRPSNRLFELQWSALGQREVSDVAMEMTRLRGLGGDVFCFLDPGEVELFHKWSMQGLFAGRADYKSMPLWVTDIDNQLRTAWGFSLSLIQKR